MHMLSSPIQDILLLVAVAAPAAAATAAALYLNKENMLLFSMPGAAKTLWLSVVVCGLSPGSIRYVIYLICHIKNQIQLRRYTVQYIHCINITKFGHNVATSNAE